MALMAATATPVDGAQDPLLQVAAGLISLAAEEMAWLHQDNAGLRRTLQLSEQRRFQAELEAAQARGMAAEAKA